MALPKDSAVAARRAIFFSLAVGASVVTAPSLYCTTTWFGTHSGYFFPELTDPVRRLPLAEAARFGSSDSVAAAAWNGIMLMVIPQANASTVSFFPVVFIR